MAASYRKDEFSVRKTRLMILLIIGLMLLNSIAVDASSNIVIDSNKAKEGVVRISYAGINKKTKIMVEKDSVKYYYDLKREEDFFPLQLGQGNYTVEVLENTAGTEYIVVAEKSFKAEIAEENAVYLKSTQPVLWDEDMKAVRLAESLAPEGEDSGKVVQALYDYVVKNISYDYAKLDKLSSDYTPDIDTVLSDGKGICYDYSVLFAAMLRSRGIPAKLVKGYRDGIKQYHAWNEVYLDGSWRIIDTTYDSFSLKAGTSCQMFKDKSEYRKLKEY